MYDHGSVLPDCLRNSGGGYMVIKRKLALRFVVIAFVLLLLALIGPAKPIVSALQNSLMQGTSTQSATTAATTEATQPSTALPSGGLITQSCLQVVDTVTKNIKSGCSSLDTDQVCYGNTHLDAAFIDPNAAHGNFAAPGDILPITALKGLTTGPLNQATGDWGVAVFKVKATNLDDTLAGQAVRSSPMAI